MKKALAFFFLSLILLIAACSEGQRNTTEKIRQIGLQDQSTNQTSFKLFDSIQGVSELDLKDDTILWIDTSGEQPKLIYKNLTTGLTKSIEFAGSHITEPKIAGKHMAFRRQYSPNNFSEVHTWNPLTGEVIMVTCGWSPGASGGWHTITSADEDTLLLSLTNAEAEQYLLDISEPRECDLWRKVTVKVGTELVDTQARYIGPDYSPTSIIEDSKLPLPLRVVCNPEPQRCSGNNQYICPSEELKFPCPTDEPSITSFDRILADEKVLLDKQCFTYRYADYPVIETIEKLGQAAKFVKANCLTVHDGKGLEVTFNISTLKFDAKQYEISETPNYKRYGMEKFHPLVYPSVPANEQLLDKLRNIPTIGYSVCMGKRDSYGSCTEWEVYVAIYSPISKETLTFFAGRFATVNGYGVFKGDIYQAYFSGSVVKEGEISSSTVLQLKEAFNWANPWSGKGSENSRGYGKDGKSSKDYLGWLDYDDNLYIWKLPDGA